MTSLVTRGDVLAKGRLHATNKLGTSCFNLQEWRQLYENGMYIYIYIYMGGLCVIIAYSVFSISLFGRKKLSYIIVRGLKALRSIVAGKDGCSLLYIIMCVCLAIL